MKKKKLLGYESLKEACKVAREEALENNSSHYNPICIYEESDGSFTIGINHTRKAKFKVAVDKSGARYTKKLVRDYFGKKVERFVKIEK